MQVSLDGNPIEIPGATSLGEILAGIAPLMDPARIVTQVTVDGRFEDSTDEEALARCRLGGSEVVAIDTEEPIQFARTRRQEVAGHVRRIADQLALAANGLAGGEEIEANRLLAAAAQQLRLVLELESHLRQLLPEVAGLEKITDLVCRVGPQLAEAERERRWHDVARLLSEELVPALRLEAC